MFNFTNRTRFTSCTNKIEYNNVFHLKLPSLKREKIIFTIFFYVNLNFLYGAAAKLIYISKLIMHSSFDFFIYFII